MAEALGMLFFLFVLVVFVKGAIRTFRRNWIAALLLMLFFTGIWMIWAFIELFIEPDKPRIHNVSGTVNNAVATTGDKNE